MDFGDWISFYQNNQNCFWTIYTTQSSRIAIQFSNWELEGTPPYCSFDYVTLHDGDSTSAPQIGGRLCGTTNPGTIQSGKDVLHMRFRSDSSVIKPGFQANFTTLCGQVINSTGEVGQTGVIISPNYPANYPSNSDCSWALNGGEATDFVRLHFIEFNLEGGATCPYDVLKATFFTNLLIFWCFHSTYLDILKLF